MAIGLVRVDAALAFLLELGALGLLGWGGWLLGGSGVPRVVLAVVVVANLVLAALAPAVEAAGA